MRGLVLAGGGAKGAYQIGAWRAFIDCNRSFDIITGTSIGAVNAALMVQGDYERANELWRKISPYTAIKGDSETFERIIEKDFKVGNFRKTIKFFRDTIISGGLDISPGKALLEEYIDEEKVRQSKIKLGIVTVSLTELKPVELSLEDIPKGELIDYLMASCNLPVFKIEPLNDKIYIDGGFYDNLPINLAQKMGAKQFTAIELHAVGIKQKSKVDVDTFIYPMEDIGGVLEVKTSTVLKNIELGYYDTLKMLNGYRGRHYYIEQDIDDIAFINQFASIPLENIEYLSEAIGIKKMDTKRIVFEKIIPDIQQKLKLSSESSYADIYIAILEKIAMDYKVERFKLRKLSEFSDEISQIYKAGNIIDVKNSVIERLFNQIRLYANDQQIIYANTIYEKMMR